MLQKKSLGRETAIHTSGVIRDLVLGWQSLQSFKHYTRKNLPVEWDFISGEEKRHVSCKWVS